jgi:hypothetical protein
VENTLSGSGGSVAFVFGVQRFRAIETQKIPETQSDAMQNWVQTRHHCARRRDFFR